jgi:ABC-type cobalamin/Fe3+-siderophores transport system ATPase subunit
MAKKRKTKKGKKATSPSTRRSTSGVGFAFEDQVAAWHLLNILMGQPLPGVDGNGSRLQMQTESLGWLIDDVLLTATVGPGDDRRLAISCKSNVQVTASGLPSDYLERAWKQWAGAGAGPMQRRKDGLVLATRGHHPAFMATWSDLKAWAAGADIAFAISQMRATAKHRKMFDSVKAAAKDAEITAEDADVVDLIRHIDVSPFDFDLSGSTDQQMAVGNARSLLANNTIDEGRKLWNELVTSARDARLGTGTLDIADLRRSLRTRFTLKDSPNFESSWRRLRALTTDHRATIETSLQTGLALERKTDSNAAAAAIASGPVCVFYGDSGAGKSAIVKSVLDTRFPKAVQIWLGPEPLQAALSEASRASLGIGQPLIDVLDASAHAENILVIDAAERLGHAAPAARLLVAELIKRNRPAHGTAWRVVIIGQTVAWEGGELQSLAGSISPPRTEVKALSPDEVRAGLRSAKGLTWLAADDDAVTALTNLRTLGWVLQAAASFQDETATGPISLVTIADKLWRHWTGDKAAVQRLLMRLAARDASFEHSFAISTLDGSDAGAFDGRPASCPLRVESNRIHFQHDLAADWARFQQLKEIAGETAQWARYADNPLWNAALRMLGQYLLRQPSGTRSAWDDAFDAVEKAGDTMPLAGDILLDALFLDPAADAFLEQRADMLFANDGVRLLRLLRRFEHVASVTGINPEALGALRDLSLYLEAQYRTPIISRWPAIARFLTKHRDAVAALTSPIVSGICERWLTSMPETLRDGSPVPFRKEFSELALATALELQTELAKNTIYIGDTLNRIHQAAFAGALDLRGDVAAWALEMAERRPPRADIVDKVCADQKQKAETHRQRLKTDADYRKRHDRRKSMPTFIPSGRQLPPWPLGPQDSIDNHYRDAVLRGATFQSLMRANPAAAAEVLLAVIIEDSPEEHYSSRPVRDGLGVHFDHESYPTAFWKSPFYSFLRINTDVALEALLKLVGFCTDRWEHEASRDGSTPQPHVLRLSDGTDRDFRGNYWLFKWSQENSTHSGQLNSALAALERWLYDLIDAGGDLTAPIDHLLRTSDSVAILGVLMNVGKYRPELFLGPLEPLLALHRSYLWDSNRVQENAYSFDGMSWARGGDLVFEMAKAWANAPHRQTRLQQVVADLITRDKDLAEFVLAATTRWTAPNTDKESVEFRMLVAELDHRNYRLVKDSKTGEEKNEFAYPGDVTTAIRGFQNDKARAQQILGFPGQSRRVLDRSGTLTDESASAVATLMAAADGDEDVDLNEEMKRPARVAAAVVLLLRARDWLASRNDVEQRALSIVDAALTEIGDTADGTRFEYAAAPSYLEFVAYFVVESWIAIPSQETDEKVMRVFTSGDDRAARVVAWLSYANRVSLGSRWWRLQYLALLWAGLSILAPRFGDDDSGKARWHRWQRCLRTRKLSGVVADASVIRPRAIAERVEEVEARQWEESYAREGRKFRATKGRRMSGGLNTHFLEIAFAWLVDGDAGRATPVGEVEQRRNLVQAFWEHEAWCRTGSTEQDDDDFKPMSPLGYKVAAELTRLTAEGPAANAAALWEPVFVLGPLGHYSIGTFLTDWFSGISETTNETEFGQRWRPMIEYMLGRSDWTNGCGWHYGQQLQRQVLGFGASLARMPGHTALIVSMRDLYRTWADNELAHGEDNVAGFCGFLATASGAPLRMDGLKWIAAALRADPNIGKWYRDSTSNAFMEFLDTVTTENGEEVSKDEPARHALLELVAHAVSRQFAAALALQERVRKML